MNSFEMDALMEHGLNCIKKEKYASIDYWMGRILQDADNSCFETKAQLALLVASWAPGSYVFKNRKLLYDAAVSKFGVKSFEGLGNFEDESAREGLKMLGML